MRSIPSCWSKTWHPLAHNAELLPAVRLLQSDPWRARLPLIDSGHAAPATGGCRAYRHRHVSFRLRDAECRSAQFLRIQVFAAARRGRDDCKRGRVPQRDGRQCTARSGDCRASPSGPSHRRSSDERRCAPPAALACDGHAQGWAAGKPARDSHRGDFNEPFDESELRARSFANSQGSLFLRRP